MSEPEGSRFGPEPTALDEAQIGADPVPGPEPAAGDPQTAGPAAGTVSAAVPPKCPTRTRQYRRGEIIAEGFPAEEISERLAQDADSVVWLDLYDPDGSDLGIVTEEFGLHPLAVEDAISDHQRPKVDRYRSHLFANMYAVATDQHAAVQSGEISVFLTHRALITVRKNDFDIDTLIARWDLNTDLIKPGNEIAVLIYGLLDAVVDGHYLAVEQLDDDAEDLQRMLFAPGARNDLRRRGYELAASLADLRRMVAPMQEVVGRLSRMDSHLVDEDLAPYFHDISDHVVRATETIDAARDRISRVIETQLNEQGAQLNEITKKLAAWAAIIAVPTAVTGFYGQNVPYPGFGTHSGVIISVSIMLVLAGGLWALLRRNGWL